MISLSDAIEFYLADKEPFLSENTVADYGNWLGKLCAWLGADVPIDRIGANQMRDFFHYLRNQYQITHRWGEPTQPRALSAKSRKLAFSACSTFWQWLAKEYDVPNPMANITAPKVPVRPVQPLSTQDIKVILSACDETCTATTSWRQPFKYQRPSALRDRTIILVLLDTGLRASELCTLNVADFDHKEKRLHVIGGKGGKNRYVYVGTETRRNVLKYLVQRFSLNNSKPDAPLFVTREGNRLTRQHLYHHLKRLGKKAGVEGANPHRFRHTFAIEFLRNNGNAFSLQGMLGHTTLDMTRRYVQYAEADLAEAHKQASPVDALVRRK